MTPQTIEQWLVDRERHYGGKHSGVPRRKVSPFDRRTRAQLAKGGMQGGDRYAHHGYAPVYAAEFAKFDREERLVIVELGILRGAGLAVLCDYFPNARIIGLEVDLSHWHDNVGTLQGLGAFRENTPEIYEFDELNPRATLILADILGRTDRIDIMIDDALHDDRSILRAWASISPFMSPRGVYFIEDNATVHASIAGARSFDRLTVV